MMASRLSHTEERIVSAYRIVLGIAVISLLSCLYADSQSTPSPASTPARTAALRVGVFDREKLLVAFYHSEFHDRRLAALQAELATATEKGDAAAIQKIEAQGEAMQDLAHRQLAGVATLANVIEPLRLHFADIAKAARVPLIVESPLYREPSVETVDVTANLVELLPPVRR
jgi:hypothetical protein